MKSVNKHVVLGYLGTNPEVKTLENVETKVAKFTVATDDSYRDKNGKKVEQTDWHNIVAWRGLAEISEKMLKKGSRVYIEGKSKTRKWDDKDGNKRETTEIIAHDIVLLDKKESEEAAE